MVQRGQRLVKLTDAQRSEMWRRYRRGDSVGSIGRALGRNGSSIHGILAATGGISPPQRRRSRLALTLAEREEISRGITTDARGDATVVGYMYGAVPGFVNAGGADMVLAKYDVDGNQLWVRQTRNSGTGGGYGIASDIDGSTTGVGDTSGAVPGASSAGSYDIVVAKFDADGNQQWAKQFGTRGDDIGRGITADRAGNVILVGDTSGTFPGFKNAGGDDIFVAKYDVLGHQVWIRQLGTRGDDVGYGVTTNAIGEIMVVGYTYGALPGASNAGSFDIFVAKYGADGDRLWVRQLGTRRGDVGYGIASDRSGDAVLVGETYGAFPGAINAGGADIVTAKFLP